eukprot:scaffold287_cov173-Amphora_coffeaeformis.AAC.12
MANGKYEYTHFGTVKENAGSEKLAVTVSCRSSGMLCNLDEPATCPSPQHDDKSTSFYSNQKRKEGNA